MYRAAIFHEAGKPLAVERLPDLRPSEGQLLVKVHRCGICGSDLHMTQGPGYTVPAGTVLGHEFTGEVVETGKGETRFRQGDVVVAMPISGCARCGACLIGEPAYCEHISYLFGGYAEYALVSAHTAILLPSRLSAADGALTEPLAVALHGAAMAGITAGSRVLVQGAGPIGLAVLFWARRLGAGHVDIVEGAAARADIALRMGADQVFHPGAAPEQSLGPGDPSLLYDVVIECVGRPGILGQSLAHVRRRGTIVSLGYCFLEDTLVPALAGGKEAQFLFPQLYTKAEFEWALSVLDRGAVEPREMITEIVTLDAMPTAFDALRHNPAQCKVIVSPFGDGVPASANS